MVSRPPPFKSSAPLYRGGRDSDNNVIACRRAHECDTRSLFGFHKPVLGIGVFRLLVFGSLARAAKPRMRLLLASRGDRDDHPCALARYKGDGGKVCSRALAPDWRTHMSC